MANCIECNDTGQRDTGGVYPWGENVYVECDCAMGGDMYESICAAIMAHTESEDIDEDTIRLVMHPDKLASFRIEMGPSCILRHCNAAKGFKFGDFLIEKNSEINGWKVVSNLSI